MKDRHAAVELIDTLLLATHLQWFEQEPYLRQLRNIVSPPSHPYNCEQHEILKTMERYGGGFIVSLAALFRRADLQNQRVLEEGFRHYFVEYDKLTVNRLEMEAKHGNPQKQD